VQAGIPGVDLASLAEYVAAWLTNANETYIEEPHQAFTAGTLRAILTAVVKDLCWRVKGAALQAKPPRLDSFAAGRLGPCFKCTSPSVAGAMRADEFRMCIDNGDLDRLQRAAEVSASRSGAACHY
jgi:hypothetical protein